MRSQRAVIAVGQNWLDIASMNSIIELCNYVSKNFSWNVELKSANLFPLSGVKRT